MQERKSDVLLVALAALAVGICWIHTAGGAEATNSQPVEQRAAAVLRAQALILEDAAGQTRGRLAVEGERVVLEAQAKVGSPIRLELMPGDPASIVVSSPGQPSTVNLIVGDTGWVSVRGSADAPVPVVSLGLSNDEPRLAMADRNGTRVMLGVLAGLPELLLYDRDATLLWSTPSGGDAATGG